jgi:hypothetical protein
VVRFQLAAQGREIRIDFGMHAGDVDDAARATCSTRPYQSSIDHVPAFSCFDPNEINYGARGAPYRGL